MYKQSVRFTDLQLFLEAWLTLHWSRVLIVFFPFQHIAASLGHSQKETPADEISDHRVNIIAVAISRAVRYALHNSKCFDKSLAIMMMLNRRKIPSTIYFGLRRDGGNLEAHAWLRCGHKIISGGLGKDKYSPIAWFGSLQEKGGIE